MLKKIFEHCSQVAIALSLFLFIAYAITGIESFVLNVLNITDRKDSYPVKFTVRIGILGICLYLLSMLCLFVFECVNTQMQYALTIFIDCAFGFMYYTGFKFLAWLNGKDI